MKRAVETDFEAAAASTSTDDSDDELSFHDIAVEVGEASVAALEHTASDITSDGLIEAPFGADTHGNPNLLVSGKELELGHAVSDEPVRRPQRPSMIKKRKSLHPLKRRGHPTATVSRGVAVSKMMKMMMRRKRIGSRLFPFRSDLFRRFPRKMITAGHCPGFMSLRALATW